MIVHRGSSGQQGCRVHGEDEASDPAPRSRDPEVARAPGGPSSRVSLPEDLIALMRQPSPRFLSTVMPDGSSRLTQT